MIGSVNILTVQTDILPFLFRLTNGLGVSCFEYKRLLNALNVNVDVQSIKIILNK